MIRTTTKSNLGDGSKLWTIILSGDPTEPGSIASRASQISLLKTLADTPELQKCGDAFFTKMRMAHDGEKWSITLEAISA